MILSDFKALEQKGRLLGIDWGARRTGIAVSDASWSLVFPRSPILPRDGLDLLKKVEKLIKDDGFAGVIIGLPLRTDGTDSDTTLAVRAFAEDLSKLVDTPIAFIDEALTSVIAMDYLGRRVRRHDIKTRLDSFAAKVILENAIALIKRG
ncbi:MAG: Holliday junction resolvase RuvX [Alphaproteobacteria bacterium]|nr:Holliday junction resolvase RuvX [Alphaproteobacteria bacterium]